MLIINWSPVRMDREQLTVSWVAPVLTVDNVDYDLSLIEDGATVIHEVLRIVTRTGDDYEVTLTLPHGPNAPESTRFPIPLETNVDGPIAVPVYNGEVN